MATTAGIGISAATLIDLWHATRKATQAVTMDEYQAVKQIVTDGQNNVEVLAVTTEVAERYEAVPYPEIKDPFDRHHRGDGLGCPASAGDGKQRD